MPNLKTMCVRFIPENIFRVDACGCCLLLVVVSGFIINYFISANKTTIIETADATQELPCRDGSQVTLNKNSHFLTPLILEKKLVTYR